MATTSTEQGAHRVYGELDVRVTTPDGGSAIDDTNDAVRVNVVAGGGGDGSILDGVSSSIKASVLDYSNSNPLAVRLTDTSGDYVSAGAGTEYTEDAAAAADPVGNALIMVRDDALSGQTTTDGDNVAARGTDKGELYVKHVDAIPVTDNSGALTVDNAGTFATQVNGDALTALQLIDDIVATDDTTTHATGTTKGAVIMAAATPTDGSVGANDLGALAMSTDRRLHVDAQIVWQDAAVTVDGSGVTQPVSGTVTANLSATDNAVLDQIDANTDFGVVVGGGVEATALRVTVASDSTGVLSVDDNGGALTVDATNLDIRDLTSVSDTVGVLQATASNLNAQVVGSVAHSAADSGNPIKVGMKAVAYGANPTAVDAAERTDWYANRHGVPFVIGGHTNIITRSVLITDANGAQTDASLVGTIAAGTKVGVTQITALVDNACTGDVAIRVGFGTANVPTQSSTGVDGMLFDHPGIAPGSGAVRGDGSAVIGIGADGAELRMTSEDPAGGNLTVTFSYFTIES